MMKVNQWLIRRQCLMLVLRLICQQHALLNYWFGKYMPPRMEEEAKEGIPTAIATVLVTTARKLLVVRIYTQNLMQKGMQYIRIVLPKEQEEDVVLLMLWRGREVAAVLVHVALGKVSCYPTKQRV